ncbi:hypothetical protein [Mucilaginibacter celer]|uniref:hypothetical protein n=1 Tax=Mucilaginibacter celer TaxID=2305508 RepID=UPI001FE20164|nr:hypothetical protein [Mucilaginibacter celer]
MELCTLKKEIALAANLCFDLEVHSFLREWVNRHQESMLLQFEQPIDEYITNNALRDFFLNTRHPIQHLLKNRFITCHLGRRSKVVYFDPLSGDPLLAVTEQRIYNLARRMDIESMHVPFRAIHPNKQTEAGDTADISTYPIGSALCYNSGNHFMSRPANGNVFNENSKRCTAKSEGRLHILFKRGFLEDRLQDIKILATAMQNEYESVPQFL